MKLDAAGSTGSPDLGENARKDYEERPACSVSSMIFRRWTGNSTAGFVTSTDRLFFSR